MGTYWAEVTLGPGSDGESATAHVVYTIGATSVSSVAVTGIDAPAADLTEWRTLVERIRHQSKAVRIGLVGKYVQLHDAYLSVAEALRHAGYALDAKVEIQWIDSEGLTEENIAIIRPAHGLHPRYYGEVLGKTAVRDLAFGDPLREGDYE